MGTGTLVSKRRARESRRRGDRRHRPRRRAIGAAGPPQAIAAGPRRAADPAHPPSRAGVIAGSGHSRRRPRGGRRSATPSRVFPLNASSIPMPRPARAPRSAPASPRSPRRSRLPSSSSAISRAVDPNVIDALIAAWRDVTGPGRCSLATRTASATRSCSTGGSSRSWPLSRATPARVPSSAPITTPANCN